jgi:phage gp46-like protein
VADVRLDQPSAASAPRGALDIALVYDQTRQGCDLVWRNGDWVVDRTPATAMLMALGCDRRANPQDTLPEPATAFANPTPGSVTPLIDTRRGFPGDALDAQGRRTGSRLWLLKRAKQTEQTRKLAESAASEALALVQTMLGVEIQLTVRWLRMGVLSIRAAAGSVSVAFAQSLGVRSGAV